MVKGDSLHGHQNFKELFEGSDLGLSSVRVRVRVRVHTGPSVKNFA